VARILIVTTTEIAQTEPVSVSDPLAKRSSAFRLYYEISKPIHRDAEYVEFAARQIVAGFID
jgi:hypothetical protein